MATDAPLPVWSSNDARHRLSRTGNRQLNAAIYRIALSQARCHPEARALWARPGSARASSSRNAIMSPLAARTSKVGGEGGMEALRILKRRLSDVVFKAMAADLSLMVTATAA